MFYQRGWDAAQDIVLATGTITALVHPELADLRAVVIGGANYRFHLADGTSFDVDQEQDPGSVCDAWTYDASGMPGPRPRPIDHHLADRRGIRLAIGFATGRQRGAADVPRPATGAAAYDTR